MRYSKSSGKLKGGSHQINRDERRGRSRAKGQLRYSRSPEKRKGEWHEINKDERRGRIRAKDQLRYSRSPGKYERESGTRSIGMKGVEGPGPKTS